MMSLSVIMTIDVCLKVPHAPTRGSGVVECDMSVLQTNRTVTRSSITITHRKFLIMALIIPQTYIPALHCSVIIHNILC